MQCAFIITDLPKKADKFYELSRPEDILRFCRVFLQHIQYIDSYLMGRQDLLDQKDQLQPDVMDELRSHLVNTEV